MRFRREEPADDDPESLFFRQKTSKCPGGFPTQEPVTIRNVSTHIIDSGLIADDISTTATLTTALGDDHHRGQPSNSVISFLKSFVGAVMNSSDSAMTVDTASVSDIVDTQSVTTITPDDIYLLKTLSHVSSGGPEESAIALGTPFLVDCVGPISEGTTYGTTAVKKKDESCRGSTTKSNQKA